MAVPTVGTTKTSHRIAEDTETFSNHDQSHIVDTSTTLLVADVFTAGNESAQNDTDFTVTWDVPTANESFTRVNLPTRASKTASDPHIQTWALLNPTVKTANVNFNLSAGTYANCVVHITNYLGTDTSVLGDAISFVADDVNLTDSTTCDITSGGTTGNLLYAVAGYKGTDTDPIDLSAGWTSISTKYDDPGGESSDWATHLATKDAASAITFTGTGADPHENNMGVMFEIAPSSGLPSFHAARRGVGRGIGRGIG